MFFVREGVGIILMRRHREQMDLLNLLLHTINHLKIKLRLMQRV
jgi:hypothetical protein